MCGIAGMIEGSGNEASRQVILDMAGELRHRGPDGTGVYFDGPVAMANTRLSIVDVEGGTQPIASEDGRYWIVHNGEIYNHIELRAELSARGVRFSTHCDTEVIVQAYAVWGVECLQRFNGAFAFAIWDTCARELFIARDRLGIRPLFIAQPDGRLLFASEAKALLRHPAMVRSLDPSGLLETFRLWATAPDRSALRGVRELTPGTYAIVGEDRVLREQVYWDMRFNPDAARVSSEEELGEALLWLLQDATRLRLRADVPVSAYLSGGLDSSAIAALTCRVSSAPRRFFALSFADARFDERVHQQQMARYLNTELTTVEVQARDIADAFPEVIRLAEKPMFRTAPAPMLLLSRKVHELGLKVVLTGEGADEVFAGYNLFREAKVRRFWARQPDSKMRPRLLGTLYPYLTRDLRSTGGFLAGFFAKGLREVDDPLYSHRLRFGNGARVIGLLQRGVLSEALAEGEPEARLIARLPEDFSRFGPLGQAQYLEMRTFMQGYLLHAQGDRMLMGNSVEGRFPFLDHRLAEFIADVPERLRIRGLQEKYLLRRAVRGLMPPEIAARQKRPYRAPILRVFIGDQAPEYVRELLNDDKIRRVGLFAPERVRMLLAKCTRGLERGVGENDEMALVAVLSTMLLHHQLVEQPALAPAVEPMREVRGKRVIMDRTPGELHHATSA